MKCVLHIGTEKTGTTLLQEWLYQNKAALSKSGIYLSDNLGGSNNRYIPVFFQSFLDDWAKANHIENNEQKEFYFKDFLSELSTEIMFSKASHDLFIITSEHLHSRLRNKSDIIKLRNYLFKNFEEVEVLCYFRNQFDVAVSLYSTILKNESTLTLDSFLDTAVPNDYYFNYLRIAENWSEVFGKECCNFKLYERDVFYEKDIRKDFILDVKSDIDLDTLVYTHSSSNESLTFLQAVLFRIINEVIPFWSLDDEGGVNSFNIRAKSDVLKNDVFQMGKISSSRREEIQDRFECSNTEFFLRFFNSENKFNSKSSNDNEALNLTDDTLAILEESVKIGFKLGRFMNDG